MTDPRKAAGGFNFTTDANYGAVYTIPFMKCFGLPNKPEVNPRQHQLQFVHKRKRTESEAQPEPFSRTSATFGKFHIAHQVRQGHRKMKEPPISNARPVTRHTLMVSFDTPPMNGAVGLGRE